MANSYSKTINISKQLQACNRLLSPILRGIFVAMRKQHSIVIGQRRGIILLPDERMYVVLNPMERTLYRLFLSHPEGIPADCLLVHWKELCHIYEQESCFDEKQLREDAL